MTCGSKDCNRPARYKSSGLCRRCHDRAHKAGTLNVIFTRGWSVADKLAHYRIVPDDPDGCYGWSASIHPGTGYAKLWIGDHHHVGRQMAHRIAYEDEVGPIPEGWHVDHLCHNRDLSCPGGPTCRHRRCTRTDHLRAVPRLQNMEGARIGERPGGKQRHTHCRNGHELSGDNLYIWPGSGDRKAERRCRACSRERTRRYQQRKRQAS